MKKKWMIPLAIVLGPPALALFVWIFGEVVMHLWNWLLPPLFGWHQVTFWQALGLLVLCRILFGGFGGHGSHGPRSRRRWGKQWDKMTPEERERFMQGYRSRCGGYTGPVTESKEPA